MGTRLPRDTTLPEMSHKMQFCTQRTLTANMSYFFCTPSVVLITGGVRRPKSCGMAVQNLDDSICSVFWGFLAPTASSSSSKISKPWKHTQYLYRVWESTCLFCTVILPFFTPVNTAVLSNHGFANCLKLCWWIDSQTGDFVTKLEKASSYQYTTVPLTSASISQYHQQLTVYHSTATSTSISQDHPHLPVYHVPPHIYKYITVPPTSTSISQYHPQLPAYHSTTNSYQYIIVPPTATSISQYHQQLPIYHSTATATSISQYHQELPVYHSTATSTSISQYSHSYQYITVQPQLPVYHNATNIYQYITVLPTFSSIRVPPTATSIYITVQPTATSISQYHQQLRVYHNTTNSYQYITVLPTATSISQYHQQLPVYHSTATATSISVQQQLPAYHSKTQNYRYITVPLTATTIYHITTNRYQYITVPPTATSISQYRQQLPLYHSTATAISISQYCHSYQYITIPPTANDISQYHGIIKLLLFFRLRLTTVPQIQILTPAQCVQVE